MQQGYAARKGKAKAKKAAKQKKKALGKDSEMADAVISEEGVMKAAGGEAEGMQEEGPGGRAGHKAKVQLKRELRVKVAQFKQSRLKLTRLPGNKQARKQLSENLKEVVAQRKEITAKKETTTTTTTTQAAVEPVVSQRTQINTKKKIKLKKRKQQGAAAQAAAAAPQAAATAAMET